MDFMRFIYNLIGGAHIEVDHRALEMMRAAPTLRLYSRSKNKTAHDQRRAKKHRAIVRAKKLGHHR